MALPEDMSWRYAVRRFVPGAREDARLAQALEAARLAPSAFGLMPWRIVQVEGAATRRALLDHAYGQDKVESAGHLLVFASRAPLTEADIDAHVARLARDRGLDDAAAGKQRASLIRNTLARHDARGLDEWCRAQCYLGLGVFLAACASQRLDACPMEGFAPARFDDILGLRAHRLTARALVTAGHRAPEDASASRAKSRPGMDEFLLTV
ncbi:MAG: nitroreductase family protein [Paracoccaceae bacterium]